MKKLIYFFPLFALLFASCEDFYMENQLGYETTIEDVRIFKYTLTDGDYGTIANNLENQFRALQHDTIDSTVLDQLLALKNNKYFGDSLITPGLYIPPFLAGKYPHLSRGTVCEVTYNVKVEAPAYYAPFTNLRQYNAEAVASVDQLPATLKEKVHKLNQKDGYMFVVFYREDSTLLYQYQVDQFVPYINDSVNLYALTNADYKAIGNKKVSIEQLSILLSNKYPFATAGTKYIVLGYNEKGLLSFNEVEYDGAAWAYVKNTEPESLSFKMSDVWIENPVYFSEPFLGHGQGDFIIQDVLLQDPLTYVWYYSATYGMCASAYKSGASYECESWLISPMINLKKADKPVLKFDQAFNKANNFKDEATVLVSTNYIDDVTTAEWTVVDYWSEATDVTDLNIPDGTSWAFQSTDEISLKEFAGKQVHIAFRYTTGYSEKDSAVISGTWELQNIVVGESEQ